MVRRRQQGAQTNVPALEREEPRPSPLTLFEEEGEAWDHKMASKYNDLTLGRYLNENR